MVNANEENVNEWWFLPQRERPGSPHRRRGATCGGAHDTIGLECASESRTPPATTSTPPTEGEATTTASGVGEGVVRGEKSLGEESGVGTSRGGGGGGGRSSQGVGEGMSFVESVKRERRTGRIPREMGGARRHGNP